MESEAGADGETDSLVDQVAVVTGGGRGLGRVIACHLAAAGARVVVASRTLSEVEETVELIERVGARRRRSCSTSPTVRPSLA